VYTHIGFTHPTHRPHTSLSFPRRFDSTVVGARDGARAASSRIRARVSPRRSTRARCVDARAFVLFFSRTLSLARDRDGEPHRELPWTRIPSFPRETRAGRMRDIRMRNDARRDGGRGRRRDGRRRMTRVVISHPSRPRVVFFVVVVVVSTSVSTTTTTRAGDAIDPVRVTVRDTRSRSRRRRDGGRALETVEEDERAEGGKCPRVRRASTEGLARGRSRGDDRRRRAVPTSCARSLRGGGNEIFEIFVG